MTFSYKTALKILPLAFILIISPIWASSKTKPFDFSAAKLPMYSITLKESQQHVNILASEAFQGRATGTEGGFRAAQYIADQFANYNLLPGGKNNQYFQNFEIARPLSPDEDILKTQNIIAMQPGRDPELSKEAVIIGAHFDHLGKKNGKIYFGADDNASGIAGLLEIAEAFSRMPIKPLRTIIFIAFTAEELGLLGSDHYVKNPTFPLKKTVAMINLDMISRNEPNNVTVIGSNRSPGLDALNKAANEEIGLTLEYGGEGYFTRSDQYSFARHDIPVIFYNTKSHKDYHRNTDISEKINPEKIARISRLAFLLAWQVANMNERPVYHPLFKTVKTKGQNDVN